MAHRGGGEHQEKAESERRGRRDGLVWMSISQEQAGAVGSIQAAWVLSKKGRCVCVCVYRSIKCAYTRMYMYKQD